MDASTRFLTVFSIDDSTRVLAASLIAFCFGKQYLVWVARPLVVLHGLEHSGQLIISGNKTCLVVSAEVSCSDFFSDP